MKKRLLYALIVLMALGAISYSSNQPVRAVSSDELKDELEDVDEELKKLRDELGDMNSDLYKMSANVADVETSIQKTEAEIAELDASLAKAEENAKKQYEYMKLRIQYMYENTSQSNLAYILEAGSISEMFNRVEYFSQISKRDKEMLEEYENTIAEIKELKAQLAEKKEMLLAKQEKLEEDKTALLASISNAKSKVDNKQEESDELSAKIKKMEAYEKKIAEEEEKRREAEEKKRREEEEKKKKNDPGNDDPGSSENPSGIQGDETGGRFYGTDPTMVAGFENITVDPIEATEEEIELFAGLIYCEAGGGKYAQQLAVGSCIVNRVHSSEFPNTLTGVMYQPGQYPPMLSGNVALKIEQGKVTDSCRKAAREALSGKLNGRWTFFWLFNETHPRYGFIIGTDVFCLRYSPRLNM